MTLGDTAVSRIDFYPTHEKDGYKYRAGRPFPFGATLVPNGVNFSIYKPMSASCEHASTANVP